MAKSRPSGSSQRCYSLCVRVDGRWVHVRTILARSHGQAFRRAMLAMKPEHRQSPIRLEELPGPFGNAAQEPGSGDLT